MLYWSRSNPPIKPHISTIPHCIFLIPPRVALPLFKPLMRQTERKTEGEGEREADGETETEKSHQGNK